MKRRLVSTTAMTMATGAALVLMVAAPSASADASSFSAAAPTWPVAATSLGMAGSLWQPTYTARLKAPASISVTAYNLVFADGAVQSGETSAWGAYGTNKRGFTLGEKWAGTGWAADPAPSWQQAPVGTVTISLGVPGTRIRVPARISANCYRAKPDKNFNIPEQPKGFRCSRSDVLRYGGVLEMTAKPPSQMTAPGTTTIHIDSSGLTYDQLVAIAGSLQQVTGTIDSITGSAQMQAMCRQMVDGRMSPSQADAFAQAYGYSTRVGTIDGEPQAVTMDYRPDRFTLSVTKGAVVSCTYG